MATTNKDAGPKTFDVAKPEESNADIGSKPMIIGHKSITNDPMMTDPKKEPTQKNPENTASPSENTTNEGSSSRVEPQQAPSKAKKIIAPTSHTVDDNVAAVSNSDKTPTNPDAEQAQEKTPDDEKSVDPTVKKMDREHTLEDLVDSKKYFVTIHKKSSALSIKSVLAAIVLPAILLAIVYVALVDAEIIQSSVSLPFDLL